MTVEDILYTLCKDQATKTLKDIGLIEKDVSTTPTDEYIQTFIDRFTKDTYFGCSVLSHFYISKNLLLGKKPTRKSDLELEIDTGYWLYRTNGEDDKTGYPACHEFIYFGDNHKAYKQANKIAKNNRECGLYSWVAIIDTISNKVNMWRKEERTRK